MAKIEDLAAKISDDRLQFESVQLYKRSLENFRINTQDALKG